MRYALGILPRAQRELGALPTETYQRLREAIFALAHEPRPQGSRKMIGRQGWRLRVGDYRVSTILTMRSRPSPLFIWAIDEMCIDEASMARTPHIILAVPPEPSAPPP